MHCYWFGALLLVREVILPISALVTKHTFSLSLPIAAFVLIIALMALLSPFETIAVKLPPSLNILKIVKKIVL